MLLLAPATGGRDQRISYFLMIKQEYQSQTLPYNITEF